MRFVCSKTAEKFYLIRSSCPLFSKLLDVLEYCTLFDGVVFDWSFIKFWAHGAVICILALRSIFVNYYGATIITLRAAQ